jgi:transcriptional regulator with XRE-family HTH domain
MCAMKVVVRRRSSTKASAVAPMKKAEQASGPRIGVKLRHARLTKGLSLRQTADRVGCSESFLSKLENDRVRPSLAMLHRLVTVLETNIAVLFDDDKTNGHSVLVFHAGERPLIRVDPLRSGDGVALERIVPNTHSRLLQGNIHVIDPGGSSDGTIQHDGEEVGYVLDGRVDLTVEGQVYPLVAGDSFFFQSNLSHGYVNPGTVTARILWINSPPTF